MSTTATYTPPELARRWRIKPDRIIRMIRRGELRAFNIAEPSSSRPRYRIPPDAIVEFENRRSGAETPKPRRRRRQPADVVQYF